MQGEDEAGGFSSDVSYPEKRLDPAG